MTMNMKKYGGFLNSYKNGASYGDYFNYVYISKKLRVVL